MKSTCCNGTQFNMAAKIVYSTWFGLAALATIVGNGVVLWLIVRNRSLRMTSSSLFLTSLAAADFLVGLVIDPVYITTRCLLFNTETYWQTYSKAIDYLWIHTTVATTFNLCCVTLDRHIAIFHPLRYEDIVTNRRCYVVIATVWFISFVLPCSRYLVKDDAVLSRLYFSFTIVTVLVPMITSCSTRNLKAAVVQSKRITDHTIEIEEAAERRKSLKNFKAAKTVSIVVGLFLVCWLPSLVLSIVHYFSKELTLFTVWTPVEALSFTSSAINLIVYALRTSEFYEALRSTFRFLRRRNSQQNCFRHSGPTKTDS